jgi:hypothetical protein
MDINTLSIIIAILAASSSAAERLTELLQNIFPSLRVPNAEPNVEGCRKAWIMLVMIVSCEITGLLTYDLIKDLKIPGSDFSFQNLPRYAFGILLMGGSSFWNSVQGYLNGLKNSIKPINQAAQKFAEAQKKKEEAAKLKDEDPNKKLLLDQAEALITAGNVLLASIGNTKA